MEKKVLLTALFLSFFGTIGLAGMSGEAAVILTPAPGPAPRINGARVLGVRPGSPFLFRIPATGGRPWPSPSRTSRPG
jgi:alpha-galactosidase